MKLQDSVFILLNISAEQNSWNSFFIWLLIGQHSRFSAYFMVPPFSLAPPHPQPLTDRALQGSNLQPLIFFCLRLFSLYVNNFLMFTSKPELPSDSYIHCFFKVSTWIFNRYLDMCKYKFLIFPYKPTPAWLSHLMQRQLHPSMCSSEKIGIIPDASLCLVFYMQPICKSIIAIVSAFKIYPEYITSSFHPLSFTWITSNASQLSPFFSTSITTRWPLVFSHAWRVGYQNIFKGKLVSSSYIESSISFKAKAKDLIMAYHILLHMST